MHLTPNVPCYTEEGEKEEEKEEGEEEEERWEGGAV